MPPAPPVLPGLPGCCVSHGNPPPGPGTSSPLEGNKHYVICHTPIHMQNQNEVYQAACPAGLPGCCSHGNRPSPNTPQPQSHTSQCHTPQLFATITDALGAGHRCKPSATDALHSKKKAGARHLSSTPEFAGRKYVCQKAPTTYYILLTELYTFAPPHHMSLGCS